MYQKSINPLVDAGDARDDEFFQTEEQKEID